MRPRFKLRLLAVVVLGSACEEPGPPVPCEATLPDHTLHVGETTRVALCFTSEALPLTYSAVTTDPAVVSVEASGRTVVMSAEAVGQVIASVTATDVNGKMGAQNMRVVVPNRAPEKVAELLAEEVPLWNVVKLDLNDYIVDPDRQPLAFEARLHDSEALEVEMRGDTLVLHALERGETSIDILATDPQNQALALTVSALVGSPLVYITQGSHSRHSDVALVAGRSGLMRLFLVTDSAGVPVPSVTAAILRSDNQVLRRFSLSGTRSVAFEVDESSLDESLNMVIEAHHLLPGARLVIDIEETNDPNMVRRIEKPLNVVEMPELELTLVPVVVGSDRQAVETVAEIERAGKDHDLLYHMRTLLPIDDFVLRVHAPFQMTSGPLLDDLLALWTMEGSRGVYLGVTPVPIASVAGVAFVNGPSVGWAMSSSRVIGHELGHIFGLPHAPCRAPGADPEYPYEGGRIGVWGYDFASATLIPPATYDIMSYCGPVWLSDYYFGRAVRYRNVTGTSPPNTPQEQVLAVQGRIDDRGNPALKSAFYTEGIPSRITGDTHEVAAMGPDGPLFSYRFAPDEIMDGPGGASFFHFIPVTWDEELSSIALTAPDGAVSRLDADTDQPYSIVIRDGEVESIAHGQPPQVNSGTRVIFSRGLPRR